MEHGEIRRIDGRTVLIAGIALATGVAIYVFVRPPGSAYLFPVTATMPIAFSWFDAVSAWLPSFIHVFGFSLLTAALLPATRVAAGWCCASWWFVDSLFELGQHPALGRHLAELLPAWFDTIPVLENTAVYFVHGRFDSADLLATALGAVCAYLTLTWVRERQDR